MPWSANVAVVLQAGNTIINPNGMFVYNTSGPGAGNLVASVAPTGTTADSFGNSVQGGAVASYGAASTVAALQSGTLWFQSAAGGISGGWAAAVNASPGLLTLTSGQVSAAADLAYQQTFASRNGSGSGSAQLFAQGFTLAGVTLPNDGNSGSTWVSGERAFMNNNWVANVNSLSNQLFAMFG